MLSPQLSQETGAPGRGTWTATQMTSLPWSSPQEMLFQITLIIPP